ncbi:hypothetical protein UFOVP1196_14 [uncultured Caudovirales phage]|uniref:Uncharacterized protein n=1 Tax=uncultured Caudovirales phage TaxID=2100421 RepID=A0A6J5R547_9CAUD|nr:hypothetical protein UFOVP1196_14 [uncultured Caudovirales phage]
MAQREDLGLSIDMLDVDRVRRWASLVEAHGDEVSKWAPSMSKQMNELADNLDFAVREIGQLRSFLAGAMAGREFRATEGAKP